MPYQASGHLLQYVRILISLLSRFSKGTSSSRGQASTALLMKTHLSNGRLVVCQSQEEDAGLVDLHGHGAAAPLHLAHGGGLLGPSLGDQSLPQKTDKRTIQAKTFQ